MKFIYIIRNTSVALGFIGVFVNVLESLSVYFFNKPLFVHFYLTQKRLPKSKKQFLEESIRFYQKLNDKQKRYFEHRVTKFIRNYDFIGREGFEFSPEVKVLIASSYVKLTFGMRKYLTNTFDKVIVYPKVFFSNTTKMYHKGEFNPALKAVVFSWEDFLLGDVVLNDNLNLGIHEFTHALTFHGGKSRDVSARIFYKLFTEITSFMKDDSNIEQIKKSGYFREYALTNKIEFTAVIMEHFFETPEDLKKKFPLLYKKIKIMLNYNSLKLKS
ncbi:conserved protein of unknown function [Tenacibaculum sp. 190130A14a]|uniref:MtfA peptidase n=1 Tax=Tenacibaculum polynesiense TaxID=3137857 RepID=A0ABP1EVG2_9FLAO